MASIASTDRAIQAENRRVRWGPWEQLYAPTGNAGLVATPTGSVIQAANPRCVDGVATERAGPITQESYPNKQASSVPVRIIRTYGGQTLHIVR